MTPMILRGSLGRLGDTEYRALAEHRFWHVEGIESNEVNEMDLCLQYGLSITNKYTFF